MGSSFSRYIATGKSKDSALEHLQTMLEYNGYEVTKKDYSCYNLEGDFLQIKKYGLYKVIYEQKEELWTACPIAHDDSHNQIVSK